MNKSIEKRLLYSFTLIAAAILIGISFGLSYIINDYFWGSRNRDLLADGRQIAQNIAIRFAADDKEQISQYLRSVDYFLRARIWYVDSEKRIVASSLPLSTDPRHGHDSEHRRGMQGMQRRTAREIELQNAENTRAYKQSGERTKDLIDKVLLGEELSVRDFHPYFQDNILAIGIPVRDEEGTVKGALLLTAPVRNTEAFLSNIYYYIAGMGLLAIVLSWLIAKLLSKRWVRPMLEMKENAAAMAKGDYSGRISVKGQDELADLGRSLNLLAEDLADFVDKTTRMEQLRRDFVANVSHELRTPITIIRGYNEAMLDGTITDEETIQRYRKLIRKETVRLEGLIKELLDISRLQARVETRFEKISLDQIVKEIAEELLVKAEEKNVYLDLAVEENSFINGIGDRIVQLVMILADNAIKFSNPGGHVLLQVSRLTKNKIELTIKDTGLGIAEKDQALIWERFYKVDKSHSKAVPGTGLGLAIAKEIIEIHKAQMNLKSRLGHGTEIKIIFPFAN